MSSPIDVLIVGAGVVGFSIGSALLEAKPGLTVTVIDKEPLLGVHASGRNSGVLHAGFYYSPDSLKAKFCREGNDELKSLCQRHRIPVESTGKVVVARDEEENSRLDGLFQRGTTNGVDLELLEESELFRLEPLARTHERFLWSPNTAISDPKQVIAAMRNDFQSRGGVVILAKKIKFERTIDGLTVNGHPATVYVNAAGAQSDRLARRVGLARDYAMVPFMGVYRSISRERLPIRRLVYPVPHPVNPFLGVHFTLTLDNKVKIGPTAIPILGREQYSLTKGWSVSDSIQALKASVALVKGEAHNFSQLVKSELPKLLQSNLIRESSSLVPEATSVKGWKKRPPGIRSQLVNLKTGRLEQDFIVDTFANSVHVLNAVSPGWTSSIPFGRWVAQEKVLKLL
jgi:L-2-hydroxyglutarate oxidase LhgO